MKILGKSLIAGSLAAIATAPLFITAGHAADPSSANVTYSDPAYSAQVLDSVVSSNNNEPTDLLIKGGFYKLDVKYTVNQDINTLQAQFNGGTTCDKGQVAADSTNPYLQSWDIGEVKSGDTFTCTYTYDTNAPGLWDALGYDNKVVDGKASLTSNLVNLDKVNGITPMVTVKASVPTSYPNEGSASPSPSDSPSAANVSTVLFTDFNENGIQDSNENVIPSAKFSIDGEKGVYTSDANGVVSFPKPADGTYSVRATNAQNTITHLFKMVVKGDTITLFGNGSIDAVPATKSPTPSASPSTTPSGSPSQTPSSPSPSGSASPSATPTNSPSSTSTASPSSTPTNSSTPSTSPSADKVATIGGVVYNDANKNGKQDPEEKGTVGAKIELIDPISKSVINVGISDAEGKFNIPNVKDGTYILRSTDPSTGNITEWNIVVKDGKYTSTLITATPVPTNPGSPSSPTPSVSVNPSSTEQNISYNNSSSSSSTSEGYNKGTNVKTGEVSTGVDTVAILSGIGIMSASMLAFLRKINDKKN